MRFWQLLNLTVVKPKKQGNQWSYSDVVGLKLIWQKENFKKGQKKSVFLLMRTNIYLTGNLKFCLLILNQPFNKGHFHCLWSRGNNNLHTSSFAYFLSCYPANVLHVSCIAVWQFPLCWSNLLVRVWISRVCPLLLNAANELIMQILHPCIANVSDNFVNWSVQDCSFSEAS